MVGVGRDLCGSSSPTPLPKQGHLQQAARDLVQAGLEYLQRRRLHNLPGQPVPVLRHPQREEVLPHVQTEKSNFLNLDLTPKKRLRAHALLKGGLGFLHTKLCKSFAGQYYRNNDYNINDICFNFLHFFFSFLDRNCPEITIEKLLEGAWTLKPWGVFLRQSMNLGQL